MSDLTLTRDDLDQQIADLEIGLVAASDKERSKLVDQILALRHQRDDDAERAAILREAELKAQSEAARQEFMTAYRAKCQAQADKMAKVAALEAENASDLAKMTERRAKIEALEVPWGYAEVEELARQGKAVGYTSNELVSIRREYYE